MASPIVRSDGPTDQYAVIRSWRSDGYLIALRGTGARTAAIVCTLNGSETEQTYGHVHFDAVQDRHVIEWNRDGCLAIEQYKRDYWDTKFYYAMAARGRS